MNLSLQGVGNAINATSLIHAPTLYGVLRTYSVVRADEHCVQRPESQKEEMPIL